MVKEETTETRTRQIPVSCIPTVERPLCNSKHAAQPSDKKRWKQRQKDFSCSATPTRVQQPGH